MKIITLVYLLFVAVFSIAQPNYKLYPISDGSKYALVNKKREPVTEYVYDFVSPFRNGYAIIQRNQKYGLINYKGRETVVPMYDKIEPLYKGLTVVTIADSCTVIDSIGNYFVDQWFYKIDTPLTNVFRVVKRVNSGAGLLIRNTIKHYRLENVIGLARDSVFFSEFLVKYLSREKTSFTNLWFSGGEKFENGKAKIAISKHTYYLDSIGNITKRTADDCDFSLMNVFIPDEYPEYPGGNAAFVEFINSTFKYPEYSNSRFDNSEVIVSFVIDKHGNVVLPKIEKSLHPDFDKEVIAAVMKLGQWKPAKYNQEPVCFKWQFPFRFYIKH